MSLLKTAAAFALLAGSLSSQIIDTTEYVPLGVFNKWNYVQDDDPNDTTFGDIGSVDLVKGVVRYNLKSPFIDSLQTVRMQLGVESGDLLLYRMRFQSNDGDFDDVELDPIVFTPPLVVGTTTTDVDVDVFENEVDEVFEANVDIGPLDEDIDIRVTGSINVSWRSPGFYPGTPAIDPIAADVQMYNWHWDFNLLFEAVDEDFDATFIDTADTLNGQGIGIQVATDPNSNDHVLNAAILPGQTVGGEFPGPGTSLRTMEFDTPGLFHLNEASDKAAGDDVVMFSGLFLEHNMSGKAFLRGMVSAVQPEVPEEGEAPTPVEFQMKGKIKGNAKKGLAKLTLKGKIKGLLEKPLVLKSKAVLDEDSEEILIEYKSGKDVAGSFALPITPKTADTATLELNTLVDTKFKVKATRKMGAEGTLDLNGESFPVTVKETRKTKEGQADKHGYTLNQTGLTAKLVKAKSVSTESADYLLSKFTAKLFGFKLKPAEITDVEAAAVDADSD
ncbi:MAG: hypothetical protein DHS20C15_22780 [Planctomycetota bacterium]|nr:MAG: hypothetical protein DHS20C15_22780 [Planctomycetota bacterium]